jgi:hypothetical protein
LLRGMVSSDFKSRRLNPATIKGYFDVSNAAHRVHARTRTTVNEIFEIYTAHYQSLGLVIALQVQAEKDLKKMKSETGTFRGLSNNLATYAESAVETQMVVESDGKLDLDTLPDPINAAIKDTRTVIMDWLDADEEFTTTLSRQDVFAAMRS